MSAFEPKTRLEKILCGEETTPKKRIEKAAAAAMSGGVVSVDVVSSKADGKDVASLDMDAGTLYAALAAGKAVKITTSLTETTTAETVMPISAVKITENGGDAYEFCSFNHEGVTFKSSLLGADDPVVLTEM